MHVERGALDLLGELVPATARRPRRGPSRDGHPRRRRAARARRRRLATTHELPTGRGGKALAVIERLWRALRLDRDGTVVALGGGCTTDAAGFAAATYLRGVHWVPVPTTLVGQVDAADRRQDRRRPARGQEPRRRVPLAARTVIDPALLDTFPSESAKNGLAEVVKTGLLAGEPLWELPSPSSFAVAPPSRRRLPPRSARPRRAQAAQPRAHVRARAGGRRGVRASRTARPSRSACSPRCGCPASTRTRSRRCSRRIRPASTRSGPEAARSLHATRRRAGRASCCSARTARDGVEPAAGRGAVGARRARSPLASVRILVLNGVNLDVIERRDPAVYGGLATSSRRASTGGRTTSAPAPCKQTNHEGEFIEWCHEALDWADGVIVNPARGRTTATRSRTRSSCSTCRSSRCTSRTSTSARSGAASRHRRPRRARVILGKGPEGYREALELAGRRRDETPAVDRLRGRLEEPLLVTNRTTSRLGFRARTRRCSSSPTERASSATSAYAEAGGLGGRVHGDQAESARSAGRGALRRIGFEADAVTYAA